MILILFLFFHLIACQSCVERGCADCLQADDCSWCDGLYGGQCQDSSATCDKKVEVEAECPRLEHVDAKTLDKIFAVFAKTSSAEWKPYMQKCWQQIKEGKCPDDPPEGSEFGWSCVRGRVWTIFLPSRALPRVGSRTPQIGGSFPQGFSELTELRVFDMPNHGFTGNLPDLSGLTKATRIKLNDNQLTGSIFELQNMKELQELWLSKNELTGTLPVFPESTNIRAMNFNNNKLTGVIPELMKMPNLQVFSVEKNALGGVIPQKPERLALCKFGALSQDDNCFSSSECQGNCQCSPSTLNCKLRASERAALSDILTQFIDQTPSAKWKSYFESSLNEINDSKCPTSLPPTKLSQAKTFECENGSLKTIHLHESLLSSVGHEHEKIEAELHPSIKDLQGLKTLILESVGLKGSLPSLSALTSLLELSVAHNQLGGPIPSLPSSLMLCTLGGDFDTDRDNNCFESKICIETCQCPAYVLNCKDGVSQNDIVAKPTVVPKKTMSPEPAGGLGVGLILLIVILSVFALVVVVGGVVFWLRREYLKA